MTPTERLILANPHATEIIAVPRPPNLPPLPWETYVGRWYPETRTRVWVWQASTFGCVLNGLPEISRQLICFALNVLTILAAPCPLEPAIEAERDEFIDAERRAA